MSVLSQYLGRLSLIGARKGPHELLRLPIEDIPFVVFDTELTGLDPKKDSIVSVGAVSMQGTRIELGKYFYRLVKPETSLRAESVVIHEIVPSDVEKEPTIAETLSEFLAFVGDAVLVGHFVSLDLAFMNREAKRLLGSALDNSAVDTLRIFEWVQEQEMGFGRHFANDIHNKDLFSIAKRYGIATNGAHNALNDAFITAQLMQRFLAQLPRLGVRTLVDLVRIGSP